VTVQKRGKDGGIIAAINRAATHGSGLEPVLRRRLYRVVLLLAMICIWGPITLFLQLTPPTYTSKWTLILPGTGAGSAVDLESIGQASTHTSSPYLSSSVDPRENYKAIVTSAPVLQAAAQRLEMSVEDFGMPNIKLLDQTALMQFGVRGASGEQARAKSVALYEAFEGQLNVLREDEGSQREAAAERMLGSFSGKLADNQARILAYQSQAAIVSVDQFKELVLSLETLRRQQIELTTREEGVAARTRSLAMILGINVSHAADALLLHGDELFQTLLRRYTEPTALLSEYTRKWGDNHPRVILQRERQRAALAALRARSQALIGASDDELLRLMALDDADSRAALLRELVTLSAESDGLRRQAAVLAESITAYEGRLSASTRDVATLEDLTRKHQVATAVFTTALAKQDIGKADPFAAYPMVQLLASPTLPPAPDRLQATLALAGGVAATLFALLGLLLLWIRKPFLQKILLNA
jgi:uncharacterized protein involved in exopolysaccharide biosynthesis